jgi:hypothetical protein
MSGRDHVDVARDLPNGARPDVTTKFFDTTIVYCS